MLSTTMFKPAKCSLKNFNFDYVERLFVENRLVNWLGQSKPNGETITSLNDFFQPNYISTQINTFFWGLRTTPDELNFAWINHLHFLGSKNLFHEKGLPIPHHIRNKITHLEFPNILSQLAYGAANKASVSGIQNLHNELLDLDDEETQGKVIFLLSNINPANNDTFTAEVIDVETAQAYYEEQQKIFDQHKEFFLELLNEAKLNPASIFSTGMNPSLSEQSATLTSIEKIIAAGHIPLLKQVGYCLLNKNPFQIRIKAEKMITRYNQASKQTEDEKIDASVILAKGLLNLHVWPDGNGRLCAHHILNLLLIKNGLTPALLDNNCLDAFDIKELRERVKQGMRAFAEKCDINTKTLDHFLELNQINLVDESPFSVAIIHNNIDEAKNYLLTEQVQLTQKEVEFFISCTQANIDWFVPYFKKNNTLLIDNVPFTWEQFINFIIPTALQNANEGLLYSALEACVINNIALPESQLFEIILKGNHHLFQLCIPMINSNSNSNFIPQLYDFIPYCLDAKVSLELINCILQQPASLKVEDNVLLNLCKLQTSSVITQYMDIAPIKTYLNSLSPTSPLMTKLSNSIKERIDLTNEEKNLVLQKIHSTFVFIPTDYSALQGKRLSC